MGVAVGKGIDGSFTDTLIAAVGMHRAWDRATQIMASEAPLSR